MKKLEKFEIEMVGTDYTDADRPYYLYEVHIADYHYFVATTYDEQDFQINNAFANTNPLWERKDFTDREWELAKWLFEIIWSSDYTNTLIDEEMVDESPFIEEEIINFIEKFKMEIAFEIYGDSSFEIYWEYLAFFDLDTCKFFEKEEK